MTLMRPKYIPRIRPGHSARDELALDLRCFFFAASEIGQQFVLVVKIVSHYGVNIGAFQGVVRLSNLIGGCPGLEILNKDIQGYSGVPHTNRSMLIHAER